MVEGIQTGEFTAMLIVFVGLYFVLKDFRKHREIWPFLLAYLFFLGGAIATNIEAIILPEALNLFEHGVGYLGSAIVFLYTAVRANRKIHKLRDSALKAVGALK